MCDDQKYSDQVGGKTLEVISEAENFNRWMYQTIKPFCKGNILEIGSGIGNISEFLLNDDHNLMLTDLREEYCKLLKHKYGDYTNCLGIMAIDLVDPNFDQLYASKLETFDTVFALNVVEHIEDDLLAIKNAKKLLKMGGHLIILVPAYQILYNSFDKELGHYKRYTKSKLLDLFETNLLEIVTSKYFNAAGILGWWVSGTILNKRSIPGGQMKLYNSLVPLFKIVDKLILNKLGLSVIVVGCNN